MSTNKKTTKSNKKELKSNLENMNRGPLQGEVIPAEGPGAPTKYGPAVVGKLSVAFNNGYNISEACIFAGIHRDTYYEWLESQPGFSDKMAEAQSMVNRRAKEVVVAAIDAGDANLAMKYLQARDPEFKAKLEIDPGEKLRKTEDKIKEFLNEPTDYNPPPSASESSEPNAAGPESAAEDSGSSGEEVAEPTPDIS